MAEKHYFFNFTRLGISAYRSDIGPPEDRYMLRWILRTPWGMLRVHKILRSDSAAAWHNHPAWLLSFLFGSYVEYTPVKWCDLSYAERVAIYQFSTYKILLDNTVVVDGRVDELAIRRNWGFNLIPAERFHRIVVADKPCWTFVIMGHLKHRWGFLSKDGVYTDFEEYLAKNPERS